MHPVYLFVSSILLSMNSPHPISFSSYLSAPFPDQQQRMWEGFQVVELTVHHWLLYISFHSSSTIIEINRGERTYTCLSRLDPLLPVYVHWNTLRNSRFLLLASIPLSYHQSSIPSILPLIRHSTRSHRGISSPLVPFLRYTYHLDPEKQLTSPTLSTINESINSMPPCFPNYWSTRSGEDLVEMVEYRPVHVQMS